MADYGFISPALAQTAQSSELVFKSGPQMLPYPYYIGYAMQVLQRELGNELWAHGWKIYTHLDVQTQQIAERTLNQGIKSAPAGIDQGALVTMSVKDGAVLAMVGGVGPYGNSPWNRAVFRHTAGSSFKPFVYLAGLTDGIIQPDTVIDDAPLVIESEFSPRYEPRNFDGKFLGWISARYALVWSRNVCSVRVAQQAGMNRVIEVAHSAGIKAQLDPYPSLALGSCAVSPLDMTTAYATLARGGIHMEPQLLRRIESDDGSRNRTYQATPDTTLPNEAVAQLVDVMQDVVRYGTGTQARLPGRPVAGKTGTADDGKDIWFIGFTPDTVTTVWGGNDRNRAVKGDRVTGGAVMARIWHDYMRSFYRIHTAPTQLAFAPPLYKLATKVPQYSDASLLAGVSPNADPKAQTPDVPLVGIAFSGASTALVSTPEGDATTLQKILACGVARAFDVQRSLAVMRWHASVLAQSKAVAKNDEQRSIAVRLESSASSTQATNIIKMPEASGGATRNADPVLARSVRDMVNNISVAQRVGMGSAQQTQVSPAAVAQDGGSSQPSQAIYGPELVPRISVTERTGGVDR